MVLIIETQGNQRYALEGTSVEAFTQKTFSELISNSHSKKLDYYLARVICEGLNEKSGDFDRNSKKFYYCYDARQLCKYIFEMAISSEGRKIEIKNFKDPINQKTISELYFFRLRHDSETPLRAEYAGSHVDFLESQSFRAKIFNQEDALDSLSINFKQKQLKKISFLSKKRIFSIFVIILFVLLLATPLIIVIERKKFKSFKLF